MTRRYGFDLIVLALALSLGACSSAPEKDYRAIYAGKEKSRTQPLEVPPELGQPRVGEQMQIPAIGREQASYTGQQDPQGSNDKVVATADNARFVRQGDMHWLELQMPPEQVWVAGREFFESLGFEITREDRQLGVMETNWQERREEAHGNWFSKLLDVIRSSGYRDQYRLRLERDEQGGTRVFITHRGLQEVVASGSDADTVKTAWEPRESDPGLEVELLQRFLISQGGNAEQMEQRVSSAELAKRTRLDEQDGEPTLRVNETFPRTWRRVGLALDRIGLRVEDRDRSEGLYYLRLTEEFRARAKEQKGFWAGLLGSDDKQELVDELLLRVEQQGDYTTVRLRDRNAQQVDPALAKRLLEEMEVHLR